MISRRRFTAGVAIALTPLGARASAQEYKAQQAAKVARIGYLSPFSAAAEAAQREAFRQGLRDLGWIEGRSVVSSRPDMRTAKWRGFPRSLRVLFGSTSK